MKKLVIVISLLLLASCSVRTKFTIPEKSTLTVAGKEVPQEELDDYSRRPFFWNKAGGINYVLKQDDKVIDEGKLQAKFRVTSIFWPPAAIIYWPMGFATDHYNIAEPNFPIVQSTNDPKFVKMKELDRSYRAKEISKSEYKLQKRKLYTAE